MADNAIFLKRVPDLEIASKETLKATTLSATVDCANNSLKI